MCFRHDGALFRRRPHQLHFSKREPRPGEEHRHVTEGAVAGAGVTSRVVAIAAHAAAQLPGHGVSRAEPTLSLSLSRSLALPCPRQPKRRASAHTRFPLRLDFWGRRLDMPACQQPFYSVCVIFSFSHGAVCAVCAVCCVSVAIATGIRALSYRHRAVV